ncbi:MAG: hypothetical protein QOI86_845 [Actinomycetota bacterium]|nr:hypothetical protein [Actinomycetota bacterium]
MPLRSHRQRVPAMLAVACAGMLVYAVAGASPDGRQLAPAPCAASDVGGPPSCADQSMSVAAANGGGSTSSTGKDSGSSTPTTGKDGGCGGSTTTTTDKGGQGSTTSTTDKGGQGSTTSTTGKDTTSTTGKGSTPTTGKGHASVAAADTTGSQPSAATGQDPQLSTAAAQDPQATTAADNGGQGSATATGNSGCGGSTPPTTGKGSTTTTTDKGGTGTTTTTRKGGGGKGGGKGGKGSTTTTTGGRGSGPTTSTTVQGGTVSPDTSTGGPSGSGGSTGSGSSPDPGSNPIQVEQVPGDSTSAPDAGPAADPGAGDPAAGDGSFDMSPDGPIGPTVADVPVASLGVPGAGLSTFGDLFGSGDRAPAVKTATPARSGRVQELAAAPLVSTGSASAMTQSEAVSRSLAGLQGSAGESAFPATIISTPKVFPVNRWDPLAASVLVVLAGLAREALKSWRRRATQIWPG